MSSFKEIIEEAKSSNTPRLQIDEDDEPV